MLDAESEAVSLPYALVDGVLLHHAGVAAHELGLYHCLAAGPLCVSELAARLRLSERVVRLLGGAAASFGAVAVTDGRLALTPAGRRAALSRGGTPARLLDLGAQLLRGPYDYGRLLDALASDGDAVPRPFTGEWFGSTVDEFAAVMHEHALPVAARWPSVVNLAAHRRLLDVGGAGGTHAIVAARANPALHAVVLELPAMAEVARRAAAEPDLAGRVEVVPGDMWQSAWPRADLHLMADVLHDWRPAAARRLVDRSFEALEAGGRLALLEMALTAEGAGPPETLASSLAMLVLTGGQQYSLAELSDMLSRAGFVEIEARPVIGPWWAIVGRKP